MKKDANGKIWATWREWLAMGRKDAKAGKEAQYPNQLDYMLGHSPDKVLKKA